MSSAFGQVVIGPPGSGKSTYCNGLQQFFTALERDIRIVNLDPANENVPYTADLDITELIRLEDVMEEFGLGPNGAMIYCLEYLEANVDWLLQGLKSLREVQQEDGGTVGGGADYFVFDMPGQVELSTNHDSLRNIVKHLEKAGYRLASVNLTDAFHVTDASKYISVLLLSLRTMLQLELPHLNVLSKMDLITQYGDLPFNLDFYTEVQDLSYLQYELEKDPRNGRGKFADLNKAICDIVEEFGLVNFQTLCVEDKMSMAALVKNVDQILGCVPRTTHSHDNSRTISEGGRVQRSTRETHSNDSSIRNAATKMQPPFELLHSLPASQFPGPLDIQEKYVDHAALHRENEKERWKEEGRQLMQAATEEEQVRAIEREKRAMAAESRMDSSA